MYIYIYTCQCQCLHMSTSMSMYGQTRFTNYRECSAPFSARLTDGDDPHSATPNHRQRPLCMVALVDPVKLHIFLWVYGVSGSRPVLCSLESAMSICCSQVLSMKENECKTSSAECHITIVGFLFMHRIDDSDEPLINQY